MILKIQNLEDDLLLIIREKQNRKKTLKRFIKLFNFYKYRRNIFLVQTLRCFFGVN
jgi:hypothetical protein